MNQLTTRRSLLAASATAMMTGAASADNGSESIDFSRSFLYCEPTGAGIRVRIQMECLAEVVDRATGRSDEYVLGVVAKTGLTADAKTGRVAPGYDYTIIFSKTHVFTK